MTKEELLNKLNEAEEEARFCTRYAFQCEEFGKPNKAQTLFEKAKMWNEKAEELRKLLETA